MDHLVDQIPSIDLADFLSKNPESQKKFIADLGEAFNKIGFVAVKNHRLDENLVGNLYSAFQKFFCLTEIQKSKYDIPGLAGQRGYTGKQKEHAKGRNTGDLKEFYHIGQENRPFNDNQNYPDNIWPDEIPELKIFGLEAYRRLEETGSDLLRAIALYLNLPEMYFEEKVKQGNSILRAIHYYPITDPESVPEGAVRAAEHEDINLITLLMGASAEGLEILRKDGKWIKVTALPNQIVVNVGDMLARLTNEKLKSTTHRVVNPSKENLNSSRYSIPFFMHPIPDMDLTCLKDCVDHQNPKKFSDFTAGEFLNERLRELGLKK